MHNKDDCPVLTTVTGVSIKQGLKQNQRIFVQDLDLTESNALCFLEEPATGKRFPVCFPRCQIGRSNVCDMVLSGDDNVSRVHFIIECESGKFFVFDNNSRNGTYLNGQLIKGKARLGDHDRLRAGAFGFIFHVSKLFWMGTLPVAKLRPTKSLGAPNLTFRTTTDKTLSAAQRSALELALQAVDADNRSVRTDATAGERQALEKELLELLSQLEVLKAKIDDCQKRLAALKHESES